ncbi:MAG: hypothetical protein COU29_01690 [Candidatus Magasanikbacteria bacterium CG10_big_fil_rev_8_21_14_0_10_36_32]|uniref:Uncharacterized protein n=1 Tax=Candidatus Magasanikbacteria bacterium CG10_big_fil_rev_8_21_14_0_10_36_32 TaxID=1974646 RepID=A0A2M6W6R9_9BACT|nr:MAG: hypothetical protein COU29_01690 [Candidatus Magasanikbacteria bacterium CG10_big_fil_rev_8_21_14_0_10_36_32]
MNERYCPEISDKKEKMNYPRQVDFAVGERTYFGRPDPDNGDYNFAIEDGLIEEYTTPEGEKRVRYTEKFLIQYDEQAENTKKARIVLKNKTIPKLLAEAEKFAPRKKTFVPEKDLEEEMIDEKPSLKSFRTEVLNEDSSKAATEVLRIFFENRGLQDKIKDIICIKKEKNGGKKGNEPRFEVKIFLQSDSEYLFFEGTLKKVREQIIEELENPTKDW